MEPLLSNLSAVNHRIYSSALLPAFVANAPAVSLRIANVNAGTVVGNASGDRAIHLITSPAVKTNANVPDIYKP